jgi:alkylhydroperoxidase family enzyme
MTAFALILFLSAPAADAPPPATAPKPVAATRDEMKEFLEAHKKARPRLPMPPADPDNPTARVNNGRFRAYYLPEFRDGGGGGGRDPDPAMTLDSTFKVKLFWVTSRTNNCYYCMGHQEHKLAAAGLADDQIAALDGDWANFTPAERAALAFTRKLTFTPHLVGPADVKELTAHYTPAQALEIVVTVAGYNSTNRWTDGLNIPAEESGANFRKETTKADLSTFKTPTSAKFAGQLSSVAPLPAQCKAASPPSVPARPALETRERVEAAWKAARSRSAVLPLADEKAAKELWADSPAPNWVRLLATFPRAGKSRVTGLTAAAAKGCLSPRLKAAIAWAAAREDRAWYALAVARDRLKALGLSDDEVFALDTDTNVLPARERLAVAFARKLTVGPSTVTDADVEAVRKVFTDREVAEVVYHTCNAAFFDRLTETADLPLDR